MYGILALNDGGDVTQEKEKSFPSKKEWYNQNKDETQGQHKLASETERLIEKYKSKGKDFTETEQYRSMQDYLEGVPQDRGGSRGSEYSNRSIIDDFSGNKKKKYRQAEEYRKHFLDTIGQETGAGGISNLRNMDFDTARHGLTNPQYEAYRQLLMDANPELYRQAHPGASGALGAAAMNFVPGVGWVKRGLEGITDKVTDFYESAKGGLGDIYENIKESDFVEDLSGLKNIPRALHQMGHSALQIVPEPIRNIGDQIVASDAWGDVSDFGHSLVDVGQNTVGLLPEDIKNLPAGVWGDFKDMVTIGKAQGGIVETMPDYFHDYSRGI